VLVLLALSVGSMRPESTLSRSSSSASRPQIFHHELPAARPFEHEQLATCAIYVTNNRLSVFVYFRVQREIVRETDTNRGRPFDKACESESLAAAALGLLRVC
jgi:hypothetical protein